MAQTVPIGKDLAVAKIMPMARTIPMAKTKAKTRLMAKPRAPSFPGRVKARILAGLLWSLGPEGPSSGGRRGPGPSPWHGHKQSIGPNRQATGNQ